MSFRLAQELAAQGTPVAVACRMLEVSTSGYYEWRGREPSPRAVANAVLTEQIIEIHAMSRESYGAPRVHKELRLGRGIRCSRKRVARLMRSARIHGVYRRRGERRRPALAVHDDLVRRRFVADAPNRLWLTDITEHPTGDGKVYCAAVLDVFSRRIVGWSIADHLRTELVVDALEMARWRRHPRGTIVHSDRGTQYTAWSFGQRLRAAGLLGSMGRVASAVDNSMMESSWRRCSGSCSTVAATGRVGQSWRRRSSSGSKLGTTRTAGTLRLAISAPSTSSEHTLPRPMRHHDRLTRTVRRTGAGPNGAPLH